MFVLASTWRLASSSRSLLLAAAVTVGAGSGVARAGILRWDADGPFFGVADGSGVWDTTNANWYDSFAGNNVVWNNGQSAQFGDSSNTAVVGATANNVDFASPIVAQDVELATASNGTTYSLSDFNGGSFQLNGNLTKSSPLGDSNFLLVTNGFTLGSGTHTVAVNGAVGAGSSITINSEIKGNGSLRLDNGAYGPGGKLITNFSNSYTGTTAVHNGTLVANDHLGNGAITVDGVSSSVRGVLAGGSSVYHPMIGLSIAVNRFGTITAGSGATSADSVGLLQTGDQTWASGGEFDVKFASTAGSAAVATAVANAGTAWDKLNLFGTLTASSTHADPFTVRLLSIAGALSFVDGGMFDVATFSQAKPSIATLNSIVSIDSSALGLPASRFSLAYGDTIAGAPANDLFVVYSVPEPATAFLLAFAAVGAVTRMSRKRRR